MKRIRTFLILTLFLVSMTGSAFAAGANTEQQTAASYLREAGIMVGNETGDMMLDQGLTRAQMAAVLTRIVANPDHVEADSAYYRGQCKFTDVPDWAKVYVGYCAANHLVAGYGNGLYGPSDPVTPAAACTVMLRCLGDVDMEWTYSTACQTAVELGLSSAEALTGAEITRGNMAVLIYRTMAKMGYDIEVSEAPQSATPAGQAMHTLIEVTAPDPETLEQRVTEVEKLCVSVDMIARRCDYKNEQAFLSSLPILALDPDIERKARRNALTSGVAAAFPFASYELSDHNGIFLGLNLYNRSPVFLDPYDDYKYTNGNWWIGGSTGAGKTVTLQCLGGRLRQQGKRVIIIAPKKGHEFRPLCEKLGGLYLRMSPSSKDCPNLMAIRRKSLDSYAKLKNIAARDDSVLADKIAQLIIWFSLKKKDLGEEDKSRLDSSLVEVYSRYGITFDNSTIVDEDGNFRKMPIISDWYEVLYQDPDTRHLAVVLSRYVSGSASAMASRNDIDLDNKYIVLDLSGMPDDMIADGTFWATSIAYDLIMNCETDLSALLADELWSLVGATANPQAAGFVLEMVKTIRGLGGIAVTSTQGMQDLFGLEGGSYGKGILDASRIKLVMQMEEQEARLIQDKLNLSEDEVRQITRFRRGEGLLCIGYNHVPVAFHTTPREYEAITTSPTDLRVKRTEARDE